MIGKKVHFTCCLIFPPQPRTCMFSFLNNNLVKYGGNEWRLETGCPQSIVPVTRWGIPPIKCYTSWRENEKYSRTCLHRLNDSWNHIACVFILLLVFYFFLFSTSLCGWQLRRRTAKRAESQDGSLRAHPINISGLLKWAAFNHRNHSGNRQFESLKNWMFDNNSNRCVGGSRCYGPSNMTSSAKSEEIYKY